MTLEEAYLEHILICLRTNDPDHSLLKTLLNSWFAHYAGRPFLDENNKPRWLSLKSSKKLLARHVHACSCAAQQTLEEGRIGDLVIDHSIPSAVLIESLRSKVFNDRSALRNFLAKRFTLALLTKYEHDGVLASWKSTMPQNWSEEGFSADPQLRFCRYTSANIDWVHQRPRS